MPADGNYWQRQACRVLDGLLGYDLPPLSWTITDGGLLTGRCTQPTGDMRREAWHLWARALDAIPAEETRHPGPVVPVTTLTAYVRVYGVRLALLADLPGA